MSTTFAPPKPDQWEGPAQQAGGFTPPSPDQWEGPARSGRGGGAPTNARGGRNPGGGQTDPGASQLKGNALTDVLGGIADTTVKTIPAAVRTAGHIAAASMGYVDPAIQDAKNLVKAQTDQARKAKEAWGHGEHVEAVGHGMAAALPVVGPAAASVGETIGGEQRYDDQGHVVEQVRPPQVARGIGQGIGLTGSVVAPEVARGVAESRPIAAATDAAADALQASAEKQYGRVLGATTKPNKVRSADVIKGYDSPVASVPWASVEVPGLLERGTTALTRKGLGAKINATVQDLGQQLEAEWGKVPGNKGVPASDVYGKIDSQLQGEFMQPNSSGAMSATSPHSQAGYEFGQSLKDYLKAHEITDAAGNQVIPFDSIRKFRQDWDKMVASKNGFAGADLTNQANTRAYEASSNGLRNILNSENPSIEAINREYSFWKNAARVIDDTNLRTSTQAKPLGRKIARAVGQGVGYGHGGPLGAAIGGGAMDAVEAAISSPAWQTVSAVAKSRLADALASGSAPRVAEALGQIQRGSTAVGSSQDNLPRYAKGGIIRRPQILVDAQTHKPTGLMAEAGPEAIVPLGGGVTAETSTVPEKPDAIAEQLSQLTGHKRRVVMIPRGTFPHAAPDGMVTHNDQHGNRFIFNPHLIGIHDIKVAVAMNRLPSILGAARGGMGAPDKSKLRGGVVNVAARSPKGFTLQSTATDKPHLDVAIKQSAKILPKGGKISIESPSKEIARRLRA